MSRLAHTVRHIGIALALTAGAGLAVAAPPEDPGERRSVTPASRHPATITAGGPAGPAAAPEPRITVMADDALLEAQRALESRQPARRIPPAPAAPPPPETEVITLEATDPARVVNKTAQFQFRDLTPHDAADADKAVMSRADREQQVERLRQEAGRKKAR